MPDQTQPNSAVVVAPPPERKSVAIIDGMLAPADAAQMMAMAEFIARSDLKPKGLKTAHDVFLVMVYGQAYGYTQAVALQCLHVVKGKVCLSGEAMVGKIQSHPLCKEYQAWSEGEGDERVGVVQSWRKGREKPNREVRFSLQDAIEAGLYDHEWRDSNGEPSVWVKYTKDMLIWKAVSRDKRLNWADVTLPDVYEDLRELDREPERNITPKQTRPAPEPGKGSSLIRQALAAPKDKEVFDLPMNERERVVVMNDSSVHVTNERGDFIEVEAEAGVTSAPGEGEGASLAPHSSPGSGVEPSGGRSSGDVVGGRNVEQRQPLESPPEGSLESGPEDGERLEPPIGSVPAPGLGPPFDPHTEPCIECGATPARLKVGHLKVNGEDCALSDVRPAVEPELPHVPANLAAEIDKRITRLGLKKFGPEHVTLEHAIRELLAVNAKPVALVQAIMKWTPK